MKEEGNEIWRVKNDGLWKPWLTCSLMAVIKIVERLRARAACVTNFISNFLVLLVLLYIF